MKIWVNTMELIKMTQAQKLLQVSKDSLRRYEKNGLIKSYRTPGGHRRYNLEDINKIRGVEEEQISDTKNVLLYCRVSTKKQEDSGNLTRQKERLVEYAVKNKFNILEIYEEVASGINEHRKQLMKMLDKTQDKNVNYVLIEYKDRLARFGFVYLKKLIEMNHCKLIIIEDVKEKSLNEEMVEDMISIITSFSARIYGKRGGKAVTKTLETLQNETTNNNTR
jgi:predicted site-specific integrase-resolvase